MPSPLAIISGATGTIGQAVTQRLWREGYSVLALGRTPEKLQSLHEWLSHCSHSNQQVHYTVWMEFPGADWDRLSAYCACHRKLGGDIAVLAVCHGAALMPGRALVCFPDMQDILAVDVLSTLCLCQTIGEVMLSQEHGSIALISSLHAYQTYPERVPYATTKAAICGMARALAVEWGPHGVRTNTILPWQVRGPRSQALADAVTQQTGEDLLEQYRQRSPMRRLVEPDDIAEAVLFLARNPACNGVELVLDGGVSQSMWYQGFVERKPADVLPRLKSGGSEEGGSEPVSGRLSTG